MRVIESHDNVGFCISNNRMAAAARGRYLLLLNNDAALHPGSLDALLREAQSTSHPVLLGLSQYTLYDGSLVDQGYKFDLFMNPIPVFATVVHEVATATGACLWVPRVIWEAVRWLSAFVRVNRRRYLPVPGCAPTATPLACSMRQASITGSART